MKTLIFNLSILLLVMSVTKGVHSGVIPKTNLIVPKYYSYGEIPNDIIFSIPNNSLIYKNIIGETRISGNFGVLVLAPNGSVPDPQNFQDDLEFDTFLYYGGLLFLGIILFIILILNAIMIFEFGELKQIKREGLKSYLSVLLKDSIEECKESWYWYGLKVFGVLFAIHGILIITSILFDSNPTRLEKTQEGSLIIQNSTDQKLKIIVDNKFEYGLLKNRYKILYDKTNTGIHNIQTYQNKNKIEEINFQVDSYKNTVFIYNISRVLSYKLLN